MSSQLKRAPFKVRAALWWATACCYFIFAMLSSSCADAQVRAVSQVRYGVNNPTILVLTDKDWKASLDSMAANGVHLLRTAISSKDKSPDNLVAFLRYAEQLSIKVILVFPDQNPAYYPPSVANQSGRKPGLAPIEVSLFKESWDAHRIAMRQAGVHVYAYELGNELNGASFNADYPSGTDAKLLDLQKCDGQPGCSTVRKGWDNYIQMLNTMRSSGLLDGTLLLGGSFVRVGDGYVQQVKKGFSTVESTRAYLAAHGADRLVDAYSFHVYPVVPESADLAKAQSEIGRQIGAIFNECRSVKSKPCWVTEWGFSDQAAPCQQSPKQDAYVEDAASVLRQESSQQGGMVAAYYSWDTTDKHAVYACGHVASPVIAKLLKSE
jgi:hypothetical protein